MEAPYSEEDIGLLLSILTTAEGEWKAEQTRQVLRKGATPRAGRESSMSLLHVLRAYESILQQRGISPDDDT